MPRELSSISRNPTGIRNQLRVVLTLHIKRVNFQSQKMKLSSHRNLWSALFLSTVVGAVFCAGYLGTHSSAQEKTRLPDRTGYVNDFAHVVDDATRQRLDIILDNVKKSFVKFAHVTSSIVKKGFIVERAGRAKRRRRFEFSSG